MKKLINDPGDVVRDSLVGFAAATAVVSGEPISCAFLWLAPT